MNIPITPSAQALSDFVFRSADRMRIDGCANAIAREGLSLALHCEQEALLDHYLGQLLTRLREQAPEHSIEVYFPTNTDSLLARFNEALARQSVEQATQAPSVISRAQIWIVHDAHTLPDAEIQLLARLIQNFPGANIRAILLMSGTQGAKNKLAAFGRKMLRWDIEVPNAEQAQAALEIARSEGRLLPVQQLLRRMNRRSWSDQEALQPHQPDDFAPPPAAPTPAELQPTPTKGRMVTFHNKGQQAITQTRLWLKTRARLALWVILGLVASTLIMLWLQPEAFGIGQAKPATALTPAGLPVPSLTMPGTPMSTSQDGTPAPSVPQGPAPMNTTSPKTR